MVTRRDFLKGLVFVPSAHRLYGSQPGCWLQVVIPFLAHAPSLGIESQIVLTSTSFDGRRGFEDETSGNEYRIRLFDARGRAVEPVTVRQPPLRPRLVDVAENLPGGGDFWGSAAIGVLPRSKNIGYLGDLFSASFARWRMGKHYDNIHANPDPPQLRAGVFHSTLPFPAPGRFAACFTVFNPSERPASGILRLLDAEGRIRHSVAYEMPARATRFFSLRSGKLEQDAACLMEPQPEVRITGLENGGTFTLENRSGNPKCFTYMLLRGAERSNTFAVEHPLFEGNHQLMPAIGNPHDPQGQFRARTLVYTPFWFSGLKTRGLTLDSTAIVASGRGLAEDLWLQPFVTGADGSISWTPEQDAAFQNRWTGRIERNAIRLRSFQSMELRAKDQELQRDFRGGLVLASNPETSHTLMKIQVEVREWETFALSHFRPGSRLARPLRTIPSREGLASDYLVTGIRVEGSGARPLWDSLLGIYNIEFEDERAASPVLQVMGAKGLLEERELGELPPLASKHVWVSELFPSARSSPGEVWTIRLVDVEATVILSAIHFDFGSRQVGIDHGSDRFSTYLDYPCRG